MFECDVVTQLRLLVGTYAAGVSLANGSLDFIDIL